MGQTVEANGRSILHKGHGMTHASAVPDVCKTPTPGGPVPIPYPNFAMDSNLTAGASSVKIEGNPVATVSSKIATSTGDEAGSVGGIMSSVFKGTCTWKMGSLNVKAEGNSVVRFLDTTFHNGNSFNTTWIDNGGPALGYADDFDGPCPICGQGPREHGIPSRPSSARVCADIMTRLLQRADAVNRTGPRGGLTGVGRNYMIGVMVCKCALTGSTPNTFATMSGDTNPGFTEIAGGTPGVHQVIAGGPATPANFVTANTSGLATMEHKWLAVAAAVQEIEGARAARRTGYNNVGQCAGAKLLARSGHAPIAMTEMFFQPAHRLPPAGELWRATYEWRIEGIRVDDQEFTAQDAPVGSCNTCQRTLYLTMCPNRVCGGGGSAGGMN